MRAPPSKTLPSARASRALSSIAHLSRLRKQGVDLLGRLAGRLRQRWRAAEEVASSRLGRAERLLRVCELLLLEPWADMASAPMALEFFEACSELAPNVEEKQRRRVVKTMQAVLGTRELADVFLLALEGLESDVPSTAVLRRRVELLVERFAP